VVKVKICGITNIEDALFAIKAGADAIGFVFYKNSPRYISPLGLKKIIDRLTQEIAKVGVFVGAKEKEIRYAADLCGLQMLQLHGDETPEFCARLKDYKVIKAFRIKRKRDVRSALRYRVYGYLFDAYRRSRPGGTGERFDWQLLEDLEAQAEIFLSGGLSTANVKEAIQTVRPDWVDVSSSLEIKPGLKDHQKIKDFIEAVRKVQPK
jgi:phosphoribosylanthranilate isomerase